MPPRPAFPSTRLLIIAAAVYALAAGAMFWPTIGFASRVTALCGQGPLDARPGWTTRDAVALWTACGPAGQAALRALASYDLVFPLVTGAVLVLVTLWAQPRTGRRWLALAPAGLYLIADTVENAVIWLYLAIGPPPQA